MPHNRFYAPQLTLAQIALQDAEFHHLAHVMRVKEKDQIELIDGHGHLAIGVVEKIERSKALIQIVDLKKEPKPPLKIILAIANLKFSHLEIALEKCTEIGVDEFLIFPCDQSEKLTLSDSQKKRIELLFISSIKQCGRLYLPELTLLNTKHALVEYPYQKFFSHLSLNTTRIDSIGPLDAPSIVIVGPEKGWSLQDVEFFENTVNAKPITLGPFIQRAETACITASACFMQKYPFKASE